MTHLTLKSRIVPPRAQHGAALIVGLVLMLVLTVLGISGMNTATLELTMANNAESHQDAFQAAETGIEIPIGQRNFTTLAPTVVPLTALGDGSYDTRSITTCMTTTPVPDIAFSMGTSTGTVQAFHFDVVAVGRGPRGAISTHNQSFYVIGPGGTLGC